MNINNIENSNKKDFQIFISQAIDPDDGYTLLSESSIKLIFKFIKVKLSFLGVPFTIVWKNSKKFWNLCLKVFNKLDKNTKTQLLGIILFLILRELAVEIIKIIGFFSQKIYYYVLHYFFPVTILPIKPAIPSISPSLKSSKINKSRILLVISKEVWSITKFIIQQVILRRF